MMHPRLLNCLSLLFLFHLLLDTHTFWKDTTPTCLCRSLRASGMNTFVSVVDVFIFAAACIASLLHGDVTGLQNRMSFSLSLSLGADGRGGGYLNPAASFKTVWTIKTNKLPYAQYVLLTLPIANVPGSHATCHCALRKELIIYCTVLH